MRNTTFLTALAALLTGCSNGDQTAAQNMAKTLYSYEPAKAVHGKFSGAAAFEHTKALVELGPRPAGSEALEKARTLITKELEKQGWEVRRQEFTQVTPRSHIQFCNLRARFPVKDSNTWDKEDVPGRTVAVLLGSHFDTKFFGDVQFIGANDAGSSTGVLMEMARVLAGNPSLAQFIELVFFDGEEALVSYQATNSQGLPSDGLYGSRYYVSKMRNLPQERRPLALVLLDMVGEKNLEVKIPGNCSARLTRLTIESARELGYKEHFSAGIMEITDDHLPFALSGVETVNIIDLEYPVWHTAGDKMDKLSPESLEMAGRTALLLVEKHLLGGGK